MLTDLANIVGFPHPGEKKKSEVSLKEVQQLERARQIYRAQGAKRNQEMIGRYVFRVWPHYVIVYAPGVASKLRPLIEKECPLIAAYSDKKLGKSVTTTPFTYE